MRWPPLIAVCSLACQACSRPAPIEAAPRPALGARANAMLDSISERLSERDLAAAAAAGNLALLGRRAELLRARFERLDPPSRQVLFPHLAWLGEVQTTAVLAASQLGNPDVDFEEGKAELLLWARTLRRELDALERRLDRIAPATGYVSQRGVGPRSP